MGACGSDVREAAIEPYMHSVADVQQSLLTSLVVSSQKVALRDIVLTCRAAQLPSARLRACQRSVGTRLRLNAHKGPFVTGSQTVSQPLHNLYVSDLGCDITAAVCHNYTHVLTDAESMREEQRCGPIEGCNNVTLDCLKV